MTWFYVRGKVRNGWIGQVNDVCAYWDPLSNFRRVLEDVDYR